MKTHKIKLVSIILPTYNEAENIHDLVNELHRILHEYHHEIIVVDDNSPDGTSECVQKIIDGGAEWLQLEKRLEDHGLRKSIWQGIQHANGDTLVWMDCDFSHPPEKVPLLLQAITSGYDMAVCSRFTANGKQKGAIGEQGESIAVIFLSSFINWLLPLMLHKGFRDYTSGFIAIRKDVFNSIRLRGDYGEYFMDLINRAILLDQSYIEIPFANLPRRAGQSKTAPTLRILLKRMPKYASMFMLQIIIRIRHLCGLSIEDSFDNISNK
ncbi:MAG: glycosyltransferase [Candidatus Peribacteraceae bacterium]|nr:glycosyltransferase [Candidatus Peribacteraceae bacterium]